MVYDRRRLFSRAFSATCSSRAPAAAPARLQRRAVLSQSFHPPGTPLRAASRLEMHRLSVPTCSSNGTNAVVAGGLDNVAGGGQSGVVAGFNNQACDNNAIVGGGAGNAIASGANTAVDSFRAGTSNAITGTSLYSFLVCGNANTLTASYGFIGAGRKRTGTPASFRSSVRARQTPFRVWPDTRSSPAGLTTRSITLRIIPLSAVAEETSLASL